MIRLGIWHNCGHVGQKELLDLFALGVVSRILARLQRRIKEPWRGLSTLEGAYATHHVTFKEAQRILVWTLP